MKMIRTLLTFACMAALTPMYANPVGGSVVISGSATIDQSNPTLTQINQTAPNTIINWQGFSIANGETTHFQQPSASAIALNRVVGNDLSTIAGSLTATGVVWLLNPAGVMFTPTAHVDVASLITTTSQIDDNDFMKGNYKFVQAPGSTAAVINQGEINIARYGYLAMVSPTAMQQGTVKININREKLSNRDLLVADFYGDKMINLFVADESKIRSITGLKIGEEHNAMVRTYNGAAEIEAARSSFTVGYGMDLLDQVVNINGLPVAKYVETNGSTITLH